MKTTEPVGLLHRTTCRLCASPRVEKVIPMQPTPIADAYLPASGMNEARQLYPLDVYFCKNCAHLQLLDVIDPQILFGNYIYVTETSPGLVEHFSRYCEDICRRFSFPPGALIVEMGSNAGVLLRFFQKRGFQVLGIDPAREIAREATAQGIETLPEFFNLEIARRIRAERGPAALVAANNVFAHSDDLAGMAQGIHHLLADDGIFVFEVSYLIDVMEKKLFDTIYHEHLSFHSVVPLQKFLRRNGLELIDVQRIATKGGSIRCLAQRAGGRHLVEASVEATLNYERSHQYDQAETYCAYGPKIGALGQQVRSMLEEFKSRGELIMGYGAAPAVTTLIYQFELAPYLSAIVDDNPRKQDSFSPGYKIPVLSPAVLAVRRPACVVILAWTYADRIMAGNQQIAEWKGQFLIPLPEPRLVQPKIL